MTAETEKWLTEAEASGKPEDEVNEEWGRRVAEIDRLEGEANKAERREKLAVVQADLDRPSARVVAPAVRVEQRGNVREKDHTLKNWLLAGTGFEDRSGRSLERNAAAGLALDKRSYSFDIGEFLLEKRTVTVGGTGTGKELAPVGLPKTFLQYMSYVCPILDYATIDASSNTSTYAYPILDDTANYGSIVAEAALIPDVDFATANVIMQAQKYTSGIQKLSVEFLKFSVGNVENKVGGMLATRIARGFARDCFSTTNTTSAPQGLLNAATSNSTLAVRGTLTADAVIDLIYSVPLPYDKNLTLVMNKATVAAVRKLKDSQNRYLWEDNFQAGQPPTVLGIPVLISQDMPTLATAGLQKVILCGDLSNYVVRVAGPVEMTRSNERYMEYGLVAFSALQFLDARFVGPAGSLRALSNPAT